MSKTEYVQNASPKKLPFIHGTFKPRSRFAKSFGGCNRFVKLKQLTNQNEAGASSLPRITYDAGDMRNAPPTYGSMRRGMRREYPGFIGQSRILRSFRRAAATNSNANSFVFDSRDGSRASQVVDDDGFFVFDSPRDQKVTPVPEAFSGGIDEDWLQEQTSAQKRIYERRGMIGSSSGQLSPEKPSNEEHNNNSNSSNEEYSNNNNNNNNNDDYKNGDDKTLLSNNMDSLFICDDDDEGDVGEGEKGKGENTHNVAELKETDENDVPHSEVGDTNGENTCTGLENEPQNAVPHPEVEDKKDKTLRFNMAVENIYSDNYSNSEKITKEELFTSQFEEKLKEVRGKSGVKRARERKRLQQKSRRDPEPRPLGDVITNKRLNEILLQESKGDNNSDMVLKLQS